jgi:hypothetical protein
MHRGRQQEVLRKAASSAPKGERRSLMRVGRIPRPREVSQQKSKTGGVLRTRRSQRSRSGATRCPCVGGWGKSGHRDSAQGPLPQVIAALRWSGIPRERMTGAVRLAASPLTAAALSCPVVSRLERFPHKSRRPPSRMNAGTGGCGSGGVGRRIPSPGAVCSNRAGSTQEIRNLLRGIGGLFPERSGGPAAPPCTASRLHLSARDLRCYDPGLRALRGPRGTGTSCATRC